MIGAAKRWSDKDGGLGTSRFGGDPCGFLSWCSSLSPAPVLTGLVDGSRWDNSKLVGISAWPAMAVCSTAVFGKVVIPLVGGVVGDSRPVQMQEVDGVAYPVLVHIVSGRLGFGCVEIFRSEGPIVACGIVFTPDRWS